MLKVPREGAVAFIGWLGLSGGLRTGISKVVFRWAEHQRDGQENIEQRH